MTIQTKRVLQAVVIGVMGLGAYAMAEGQTPDANQVPQTAAQVQADAVRRSDLMPAETTYGFAGYGEKGFFIRDTDKYFSLNLGAFAQFRNVSCIIGEHEGSKVVYANGFEWRRLELSAEGNMFKDLNYVLVAEYIPGQQGPNPALRWDANYSGIRVQTAYVSYEFQNFDLGAFGGGSYALPFPVTIRGGQFKDPTIRESSLSSKYQMAVDRSFQNTWIGGAWTGENYIQGIGFNAGGTKDDVWRAELDIHEGPRTGNTDWTDPINPNTKNWGISTRGEYKISGSWKDYSAFTTKGKTQGEELLIVGGGIAWSEPDSAYVARHPVTRVNSLRYIDREINVSVDGTWKPNIDGLPIGVFGAITGQFIDIDSYQTPATTRSATGDSWPRGRTCSTTALRPLPELA